jgi:hypothetical protein
MREIRITVMQMECWRAAVLSALAAYIRRANASLLGESTQLAVCAFCCYIEQL